MFWSTIVKHTSRPPHLGSNVLSSGSFSPGTGVPRAQGLIPRKPHFWGKIDNFTAPLSRHSLSLLHKHSHPVCTSYADTLETFPKPSWPTAASVTGSAVDSRGCQGQGLVFRMKASLCRRLQLTTATPPTVTFRASSGREPILRVQPGRNLTQKLMSAEGILAPSFRELWWAGQKQATVHNPDTLTKGPKSLLWLRLLLGPGGTDQNQGALLHPRVPYCPPKPGSSLSPNLPSPLHIPLPHLPLSSSLCPTCLS